MATRDTGVEDGLTVEERQELRRHVLDLSRGQEVVLVYESTRSTKEQRVEATVGKAARDEKVLAMFRTDEREGDLYVRDCDVENLLYDSFRVVSTGSRWTNRQTMCGYLTGVEGQ